MVDHKSEDSKSGEKITSITYGEVPKGFVQEIPKQGPPTALMDGKVYEASGAPSLMRNVIVRFRIENAKIIQIPLPN